MTTSVLHLELLIGGRFIAPSTVRPIARTSRESTRINPFARRPLGVPRTRADRTGILVLAVGLALIFAGVLVG